MGLQRSQNIADVNSAPASPAKVFSMCAASNYGFAVGIDAKVVVVNVMSETPARRI